MGQLILYVTGVTEASRRAREELEVLVEELDLDTGQVEVVDVAAHPDRAERDGVLATPTLATSVSGGRRVVGDLSDHEQVCAALELRQPDDRRG